MPRSISQLFVVLTVFVAPLGLRPERLADPAPWIVALAWWAVLASQPEAPAEEIDRSTADRGSFLAIAIAAVVSQVAAIVDFGWFAQASAVPAAGRIAGVVAIAAGVGLRVWSIRTLGRWFTSVVRTAADQQVVRHGPYRLVRHPSYSGALLVWVGAPAALGSVAGIALAAGLGAVAYAYRITVEERALVAALGDAYVEYRRTTARLVPFVF